MGTTDSDRTYSFSEILATELRVIKEKRNTSGPSKTPSKKEPLPHQDSDEKSDKPQSDNWQLGLTGLALSGGGIRSATFNLGILQALAQLKLLRRLDYLSTVSGGGYIGAWLIALIQREQSTHPVESVEARLAPAQSHSARPNTDKSAVDFNREDPAIRFLRGHSNFLTPRKGLLSGDTWSLIATYSRNTLLNLTILISAIATLLLFPRLIAGAMPALAETGWTEHGSWVCVTALLLVAAAIRLGRNIGSFTDKAPESPNADSQNGIIVLVVLPVFLAALLATDWLPLLRHAPDEMTGQHVQYWSGITAALYFFVWLLAALAAHLSPWSQKGQLPMWTSAVLWSLPSGYLSGLALPFVVDLLGVAGWENRYFQVAIGPSVLVLWIFLLFILHIGLMGRGIQDQKREWLSCVSAWLLILLTVWTVMAGISFFGPLAVDGLSANVLGALASSWIATTIAGLLIGGITGREGKLEGIAKTAVIAVAPYVFIVGLLVLLSWSLTWVTVKTGTLVFEGSAITDAHEKHQSILDNYLSSAEISAKDESAQALTLTIRPERIPVTKAAEHGVTRRFSELRESYFALLQSFRSEPFLQFSLFVAFAVAMFLLGWRIDINEFSLHRLYRNRLTRCYLGASVKQRFPQPFTGFCRHDDLWLRETDDPSSDTLIPIDIGIPGPYPIINATINLVAGQDLAWQDRKAAAFLLSPLFCGFDPSLLSTPGAGPDDRSGGYRCTRVYATEDDPLTLGEAMTISGAAASPSMGFHTTPAFAFLLTLFNVRLGRWIGNPLRATFWTKSSPRISHTFLLYELLGLTNQKSPFVYLSDGGHFENLGLYELVHRRCRYIIVCDATADPDRNFEDLGNAIRKCRVDFGVEIDIDVSPIRDLEHGRFSRWPCAVGTVKYASDEIGTLVYIKPSLLESAPDDILNYAAKNPSFPHQTTGDQFFDESQFESYRQLGYFIGMKVLQDSVLRAKNDRHTDTPTQRGDALSLEKLFMLLRHHWYAPSPNVRSHFTRHTQVLDQLFNRLRTTEKLAFLTPQFYPEWRVVDGTVTASDMVGLASVPKDDPTTFEQGFYFCNSLIQLMENVYLDLNLEAESDHPDNRGWMNLFRHWSWSGMFRVTWAISAATYGNRFQLFCEHHLGLAPDDVVATKLDFDSTADVDFRDSGTKKPATLNFLERKHIQDICRCAQVPCEIFQLDLSIGPPRALEREADALFKFNFGYAVVRRNELIMFRVQDHLRRMGLGRRGLSALLEVHGDELSVPQKSDPVLDDLLFQMQISGADQAKFLRYFSSARQQWKNDKAGQTETDAADDR